MTTQLQNIGHFINGQLLSTESGRTSAVFNPATGALSANVSLAGSNEVNAAVAAAQAAFPAWSAASPLRRARIMFKFKELMEKNADKLAAMITAEHGKVFTDARGEVARGIEVVDFPDGTGLR